MKKNGTKKMLKYSTIYIKNTRVLLEAKKLEQFPEEQILKEMGSESTKETSQKTTEPEKTSKPEEPEKPNLNKNNNNLKIIKKKEPEPEKPESKQKENQKKN